MSCVEIFMDRYTFRVERNQRATRARHGCTTRHGRPCRCRRTCPVPRLRSESHPSPRAQLGWTITTTIIPRPSLASLGEGGSSHGIEVGRLHLEGWPHLPTVVSTKTDSSYRHPTASGASIRSVQVKRRWIIGPAAPPHPAAPMKMCPRAQLTSLTYKRSLTPAGLNT
jgi:hypothetical protein